MSRLFRLFPCCLLLAACLPLTGCPKAGPSVACVDVERVMTQSKAARQANEHLGKVQAVLQDSLTAYQKELQKNPSGKRQQELQQGTAVLQRQLALEQAAARNVVTRHMLAAIDKWRAGKSGTVVIARQNLLAAPDSADISDDIIAGMDAGSVAFPDLPRINLRAGSGAAPAPRK